MSVYYGGVVKTTPGVVGYWPLDDANTSDLVGGRSLTLSGTPTAVAGNNWWRATQFNGSSQYGSTASDSALVPTSFTAEVWAYKDSGTGLYSVIGAGTTGNPLPWGFDTYGVGGNNKWRAFITGNGGGTNYLEAPDSVVIVNGVWVHLLATYDNPTTTLTLYKDGTAVGSDNTTSGSRDTGTYGLQVARYNGSFTQYFPGRIAHVALYDRVLSADEIRRNYLMGTLGRAGLTVY